MLCNKKKKKVKCKKATMACGMINISNYVNNFLSTNPTTLIFSSLESEFDKESKSGFFRSCVCGGGLGEG